jgi:hypothetical protein
MARDEPVEDGSVRQRLYPARSRSSVRRKMPSDLQSFAVSVHFREITLD